MFDISFEMGLIMSYLKKKIACGALQFTFGFGCWTYVKFTSTESIVNYLQIFGFVIAQKKNSSKLLTQIISSF